MSHSAQNPCLVVKKNPRWIVQLLRAWQLLLQRFERLFRPRRFEINWLSRVESCKLVNQNHRQTHEHSNTCCIILKAGNSKTRIQLGQGLHALPSPALNEEHNHHVAM